VGVAAMAPAARFANQAQARRLHAQALLTWLVTP
jgi:hypothetical protein